jgi:hypothetical protein
MDDEIELSNFPAITPEDLAHDQRLNFMIVENWTRTKSAVKILPIIQHIFKIVFFLLSLN